jgi:penicillin-binding protein-related factor A (putative recombinase)
MNVSSYVFIFVFMNDFYMWLFSPLIKYWQKYNKKRMRNNVLKQVANEIENMLELVVKKQ